MGPQVPTGWPQTSCDLLGLHLSVSKNSALCKRIHCVSLPTEAHLFIHLLPATWAVSHMKAFSLELRERRGGLWW